MSRSSDFAALLETVHEATVTRTPLRVQGSGHHSNLTHRGKEQAQVIDIMEYHSLNFYKPEELVLSVQAGMPLVDIAALLASKRQRLCCSFRNLSGLFGEHGNSCTLGGGLALGLSGSDRINHYAIRDSVLGMSAINGHGELLTLGGRVFKNVTGYDLTKLLIGSLGTLGIIAEVNLRLRPLAETEVTARGRARDMVEALQLMARALNSPLDISGAYAESVDEGYSFALRLEGLAIGLQERRAELMRLVPECSLAWVEEEDSQKLWNDIKDMRAFDREKSDADLWLLSQPASRVAQVFDAITQTIPGCKAVLDWGGAQLWLSTDPGTSVMAGQIATLCAPFGATLCPIRVAAHQRIGALNPDRVQEKILHKLYHSFDPHGIFQPERLYENFAKPI